MLPFNPFTAREHFDFILPGEKPAALLVHGFPGTPAEMRPLAESLHDRGWTVRGLLLPGFGSDLDTLPCRRAEEWIGAVKEALLELRSNHSPVMLVGDSMGAAVSIGAAEQAQVDGLVILSPFWRLASAVWPFVPLLCRLIPSLHPFWWMKVDYQEPRVRLALNRFFPHIDLDKASDRRELRKFKLPLGVFDQIRRAGAAAYSAAGRVHIPVLSLQGAQDPIASISMTRLLLKQYAGPVRYAELEAEHDLLDIALPVWESVRSLVLGFARTLEPVPVKNIINRK